METLQIDLDEYMNEYNSNRTHQLKKCQGIAPIETFRNAKKYFVEKNLNERLVV